MSKFSRRKLIAGAAAAPLALTGVAHGTKPDEAAEVSRTSRAPPSRDPVVAKVEALIVERAAIEAMMEEWADLEVALCTKIKSNGMSLTRACRSQLPEARAMRALDRKIKLGFRRMHLQARRIVLMRPSSPQGALAKIKLGVRIQGPYDWNDEYVYALVQDGCEQLALMLSS